jgi:hypothetical protein
MEEEPPLSWEERVETWSCRNARGIKQFCKKASMDPSWSEEMIHIKKVEIFKNPMAGLFKEDTAV